MRDDGDHTFAAAWLLMITLTFAVAFASAGQC